MPSLEHSVSRHIDKFIKEQEKRGYDIKGLTALKITYITTLYNSRRLILPDDILLHMFEYLCLGDMITITSTSTKYRKLYPNIWGIFQTRAFPLSIIPQTEYKTIRDSVALDEYYMILRNHAKKDINWLKINIEENHMTKINAELEYLQPKHMSYEIRYITNKNELNAGHERNLEILDETKDERLPKYLFEFLCVSKKMTTDIPYFTIKKDIDSRLYGWNPITNPIEYETSRKWITGEYNDSYEYGEYGDMPQDPEYRYEMDSYWRLNRRFRIRPNYC
jgi:hypothetical protein